MSDKETFCYVCNREIMPGKARQAVKTYSAQFADHPVTLCGRASCARKFEVMNRPLKQSSKLKRGRRFAEQN